MPQAEQPIQELGVLLKNTPKDPHKMTLDEHNRLNRFEPAIRFILEAKQATILLAEGNQEKNRDFLKKSVRTYRWRINRW
jgi:hypothetical protein